MTALDVQLSTTEAAAVSGVTLRQIDYWCRLGLLDQARPAAGSGTRRVFDGGQVATLCYAQELRSLGLEMTLALRVAPLLATGAAAGRTGALTSIRITPNVAAVEQKICDVIEARGYATVAEAERVSDRRAS